MTALDDLDRALGRMQGDDSGGPLAPALDAARRVRAEKRTLTTIELRIIGAVERQVQRVGARVAATVFAVGALLGDGVPGHLCLLGALVCLACADYASKTTVRMVLRSFREHPWVWATTVVLGAGGGLAIGHALGSPSTLSTPLALAVLLLGLVWIALVLRAGQRGREVRSSAETVQL